MTASVHPLPTLGLAAPVSDSSLELTLAHVHGPSKLDVEPQSDRELLVKMFDEALKAVDPKTVVSRYLPQPGHRGRTIVIGAGKAAARMAAAVEEAWSGPLEGIVVTRYGHGERTRHVRVIEAGHPAPDAAGRDAARQILALAQSATADDLVICLMSGGGSALLSLPADGIAPEEKAGIAKALLQSGAPISEINCVRTHLSAIKGGQLGVACGEARVVTLIISDVPGDDPALVASGPTVPCTSTALEALDILRRRNIWAPFEVMDRLRGMALQPRKELGPRQVQVIATAQTALAAAGQYARSQGLNVLMLGGSLEGESRDVAAVHAGIAAQIATHGEPTPAPCVILSGGETTVTVRGGGRGGRNAEFLLALALAADGLPLSALACDTDGIDGVEANAGAFIDAHTLARARGVRLDAQNHLFSNDAYTFFERLGDLVVTGPTRTNVNDFRAVLVR
ncbi:glycerate kinase [Acidovorax sp. sic0104]|nr:glycerate kinase [Acidovorax sp. sic0104]